MPKHHKLSEIKTNIVKIIENLQQLEQLSNAPHSDFDGDQALRQEQDTTSLLSELEQLPCERIAGIQNRRKRRRQKAKKQMKGKKERVAKVEQSDLHSAPTPMADSLSVAPAAEHITLKKQKDASNILTTIDLLERLHKARGGDDALSQQLAPLRLVWRRIQQENKMASEGKVEENLQAQWDKVMFGSSSPTAVKRQKAQDFLKRR